jgi:hypothetical protein
MPYLPMQNLNNKFRGKFVACKYYKVCVFIKRMANTQSIKKMGRGGIFISFSIKNFENLKLRPIHMSNCIFEDIQIVEIKY